MSNTVSTMDRPELWHDLLGLSPQFAFQWNLPIRSNTSLGMSLMLRCAAVKARDIAKSGMNLWREDDLGRWNKVRPAEHWLARKLARRPNDYQSWGEFWRMVILHLEIAGDAYILPRFSRIGEVVEFLPVVPTNVRLLTAPGGREYYEIAAVSDIDRGRLRTDVVRVPREGIIHIKGKSWDGIRGISNAVLGEPLFSLVDAIQAYQTSLFGNNGKVPVSFETDSTFEGAEGEAAFERLKSQLRTAVKRMQVAGDPLVLEGGMHAKVLAFNSRDNYTKEAFDAMVVQVCSHMDMPPHKIYALETVKYSNASHLDDQYVSDNLIPTADNIEEKLRLAVLTDEELDDLWPEFDRERMTAQDSKSINERVKTAVGIGVMMQNEARERLGLNPTPGGNVFTMPVNMAIVDENGNVLRQAASGQPNNDGTTANAPEDGDDGPRLVVDNT